jgi:hypothetical protein
MQETYQSSISPKKLEKVTSRRDEPVLDAHNLDFLDHVDWADGDLGHDEVSPDLHARNQASTFQALG